MRKQAHFRCFLYEKVRRGGRWYSSLCVAGSLGRQESAESRLGVISGAFRVFPGVCQSSEIKLVRHPDASRGLPANHSSSEIKLIAFPMTFLSLPRPIRHRDQKNCRNRCASCQIQGKNVIGNSLFLKFADQQPRTPVKLSAKTSLFFFPLTSSHRSRSNCQQKHAYSSFR